MVNIGEFTKRLNRIMDYYDLTAASFADKIDVGRSSISHLLSGRNNPSLDFVLKVVTAFPEVDLYWLLNGKGDFPKPVTGASPTSSKKNSSVTPDLFNQEKPIPADSTSTMNKEIKKVVIFYKDGTFEAYEN